MKILHKEHKN